MTDARITQAAIEVIREEDSPAARASQTTIEVVRGGANTPDARLSQTAIEVVRGGANTPDAYLSQAVIEVVRANAPPTAVITQSTIEVLRHNSPPFALLSQAVIEVIRVNHPEGTPVTSLPVPPQARHTRKPAIPDPHPVQDRACAAALHALKEIVEQLTARRGPRITKLGSAATLANAIVKVNEFIDKIQE